MFNSSDNPRASCSTSTDEYEDIRERRTRDIGTNYTDLTEDVTSPATSSHGVANEAAKNDMTVNQEKRTSQAVKASQCRLSPTSQTKQPVIATKSSGINETLTTHQATKAKPSKTVIVSPTTSASQAPPSQLTTPSQTASSGQATPNKMTTPSQNTSASAATPTQTTRARQMSPRRASQPPPVPARAIITDETGKSKHRGRRSSTPKQTQ